VQGAVKKQGALRKALGVKKGKAIPVSKIRDAARRPCKRGQQAQLALAFRGMNKKWIKWREPSMKLALVITKLLYLFVSTGKQFRLDFPVELSLLNRRAGEAHRYTLRTYFSVVIFPFIQK